MNKRQQKKFKNKLNHKKYKKHIYSNILPYQDAILIITDKTGNNIEKCYKLKLL